MKETLDFGIDLLAHNVDGLVSGKAYVLSGGRDTGKSTFALQFLAQGLKERQTCVLVTSQPPKAVVAHAESLKLDILPHLKSGKLRVYEPMRNDYEFADLLRELETVSVEAHAGRFVLEGLEQASSPSADGLSALLAKLEKTKTTTLVTFETPLPEGPSALKAALENGAAAGSFRLESTADERVKTFTIAKLAGARADALEFEYTLEPGRGVVEKVKAGGIKFPRAEH